MAVNKILLVLMFLATTIFSEDDTITYIVYLNKLPRTTEKIDFPVAEKQPYYYNIINLGKKDLKSAGGQPFRLTQVLRPSNTNYALITITPKDDWDKSFIQKCVDLGIMEPIQKQRVVSKYNPGRRGYITEVEIEKIKDLPDDFNLYEVGVSTK